jgi:hypothetical protein
VAGVDAMGGGARASAEFRKHPLDGTFAAGLDSREWYEDRGEFK